MIDEDLDAQTVMAALAGGAMSRCPHCDVNTLSTLVYREDSEHPDQKYCCTACNLTWEIFMPEGLIKVDNLKRGLIPFDDKGNQRKWEWGLATRFRPNFAFEDTLIWCDQESRRNYYDYQFKRKSTGKMVQTLGRDFRSFLPLMVRGELTGKFTFRKRGGSVGVTFFKEKKPPKPRKSRARKRASPVIPPQNAAQCTKKS